MLNQTLQKQTVPCEQRDIKVVSAKYQYCKPIFHKFCIRPDSSPNFVKLGLKTFWYFFILICLKTSTSTKHFHRSYLIIVKNNRNPLQTSLECYTMIIDKVRRRKSITFCGTLILLCMIYTFIYHFPKRSKYYILTQLTAQQLNKNPPSIFESAPPPKKNHHHHHHHHYHHFTQSQYFCLCNY